MSWQWPAGAACGFLIALVTTPAGVSGAVLLLPVQLSVLGVASPAVTPTNLLFNVVSVPGGLLRFWHERRLTSPLSGLLIAGTLPGVIAGAIIRVELLSGARTFMFIAAGVLLPLGLWLLLGAQRITPSRPEPSHRVRGLICVLALVVGTVGGIYGIGGGSLLAPILLAAGFSAYEVAPATACDVPDLDRRHRDLSGPSTDPRRERRARVGSRCLHRGRRLPWKLSRSSTATPYSRSLAAAPTWPDRLLDRHPLYTDRDRHA